MNLPDDFINNMQELFSDPAEMSAFLASFQERRHFGLRVNTLKISIDEFVKIFDSISQVPWCSTGFYYTGSTPASKNPLYHAGLYYIQEPSAMSAAGVLDVKPGDKVLDLCASPGGKTTQIASALSGSGLLVSNDANLSRIPQLVRNIEMAGITNAVILREKPERLALRFAGYFDKVLVDAPCSGEGMFRKDPEAIAAWDKNKSARLAGIQADILYQASKMVAPRGYLVYSTCTFSQIENENVIDKFLSANQEFCSVAIEHVSFGISPANQGLVTNNSHAARIWPHRQKGEGHFIALLRKKDDISDGFMHSKQAASKNTFKYYDEFCGRHLTSPPSGKIFAHKDTLYALPDDCPDLSGLHTVRPGLLLGALKKNRFVPSYHLAMSLKMSNFSDSINLAPENPLVGRYLSGETFDISASDGYNLFCIEGFPLGFAKIQKGRLKGRINAMSH